MLIMENPLTCCEHGPISNTLDPPKDNPSSLDQVLKLNIVALQTLLPDYFKIEIYSICVKVQIGTLQVLHVAI